MTAGRWFATGPDLEAGPSASTEDMPRAILAAVGRARLYGVGVVWEILSTGAVPCRRFVRHPNGTVTEDSCGS